MGALCGSGRTTDKDDEVLQRGSISTRSLSNSNVLQVENQDANSKKTDSAADDERMTEKTEEELRKKASTQRKRLTLTGDLVGKAKNVSLLDLQNQLKELQKDEEPAADMFQDCHYVALSKKGYVPYDEKVNQDSLICLEKVKHNIPNLDMHFFGVLDGHGHHGRPASQEVTASFPKFLQQELAQYTKASDLTDEVVGKILSNAIDKTHTALLNTNIPLQHSGTTFCGSLIFNNMIYTANVGDSQGFMLSKPKPSTYKIQDLNFLHNPDTPSEKERIRKAGGVVSQIPGLPKEEAGPFRVWLPDMSGPGLAMARSLGDTIAHTVGAIHNPSIDVKRVDATCKYCLWATDGVFEFLSTDDVAKIILNDDGNLKTIAKNIVKRSVKMWRTYDQVVDDITVVLLQLPEMSAQAAE